MAAPSFIAAGAGAEADSADLSVPYPAGLEADDLLILHTFQRALGESAGAQTPADWTLLYEDDLGGTGRFSSTFVKKATGSESGSLTVSPNAGYGNMWIGRMYLVRDWLGDATWANNFESGGFTSAATNT